MEHKLTDMLLMLIERGYSLNSGWLDSKEYGVTFIENQFNPEDANTILKAWRSKEESRSIDPTTTFGMLRRIGN